MDNKVMFIILSTSVITYILRYMPISVLKGKCFPWYLKKYLQNLPVAILTALILQSIFLQNGSLRYGWEDYYVVGFITCILLATFTRNLIVVIFGGIAMLFVLNTLF